MSLSKWLDAAYKRRVPIASRVRTPFFSPGHLHSLILPLTQRRQIIIKTLWEQFILHSQAYWSSGHLNIREISGSFNLFNLLYAYHSQRLSPYTTFNHGHCNGFSWYHRIGTKRMEWDEEDGGDGGRRPQSVRLRRTNTHIKLRRQGYPSSVDPPCESHHSSKGSK